MYTTSTIEIRAPIERVFECICSKEKQKLWVDGLVHTEYKTRRDEENVLGAEFKQRLVKGRRKVEYELSGRIIAHERPTLYGVRISNDDFDAEITYRLKNTEGGTRLMTETRMLFNGGLVARFISRMAAHHNKQDMKKLIALAEQA